MIVCTLFGYVASHKLSLRVEELKKFLHFLSSVKTEIRYLALPPDRILEKHKDEMDFLKRCSERLCGGETDFPKIWEEELQISAKRMGLRPVDMNLIKSFGMEFGTTDLEGQLSECELYEQLLTQNLEQARTEQKEKANLYQMLGVFGGLATVLLIC